MGAPQGEHVSRLPLDLPRLDEVGALDEQGARPREELAAHYQGRPHPSAMFARAGRLLRLIGTILFTHVHFGQRNTDNLRDLAARGTPIYVMQSRSFLDYLYFNYIFLRHDLPLAQYANGVTMTWILGPLGWLQALFRRKPDEPDEVRVQALVEGGEPVFLFLERPRKDAEANLEFSQKYLTRLIRAQKHTERALLVVPMLLVWEKRPDPKRAGLLEEVFGTAQRPGFWRKFLSFFQTFWQSFFKIGQPQVQISTVLNLGEFLREYPLAGSADASELLRDRLIDHLERERNIILGPTGESPEALYEEIIRRPVLLDAIESIAREEGVGEEVIRRRVRQQFDEIAAAPSPLMLKVWSSVLSFVWYRIYDGIDLDIEGLDRVRDAAREASLVLIPSHKSHIDYLVMSDVMYKYGMVPPLVAAGVNLSFWPMGPLFRWAGGFFIRRSFRGETLYPLVFREYLIRQMQEGYPIEFFIEGTRSRTGKLIKPKYGMLEMIIRAYTSGRVDALKIVPISVGYEKIIEERSYRRELLGGEKQKESLGGLLKTPKFLTSKYGRLYIEFAPPIDLGAYLDRYEVDRLRPDDEALDSLTVRLAHRVIYEINHVATVSPTALTAMVLLARPAGAARPAADTPGMSRDLLLERAGFVLDALVRREDPARLSGALKESFSAVDLTHAPPARWRGAQDASPGVGAPNTMPGTVQDGARTTFERTTAERIGEAVADVVDEAIGLFQQNKQIRVHTRDGQIFYALPEESRPELAYYRNNIVHYFVPQALLAAAIGRFDTARIPMGELMEETRFLSRLFKYEWIYEERARFENVFLRTLAGFEAAGWVQNGEETERASQHDDALSVTQAQVVAIAQPFPAELVFFAGLVTSLLEAYALVADVVAHSDATWERDAMLKQVLKKARADYAAGGVLFYETLSKPTFKNAVHLLEDWGCIERLADTKKGSALSFRAADDWDAQRFGALQERLRAFIR